MTKGPVRVLDSKKELEFKEMVKKGASLQKLADHFGISLTTVKRYKSNFFKNNKSYNAKGKTLLLNAGTDKGKLEILTWFRENFSNVTEKIFIILSEFIEEESGKKINVGEFEWNSKKEIKEYIEKTGERSIDVIAHETNFSKRTVKKYCKENNISVEGKIKSSIYKKNIIDRWK